MLVHYDISIVANILLKEVIGDMGLSGKALKNFRIDQKILHKCQRLIDKRYKDEAFRKQLHDFVAGFWLVVAFSIKTITSQNSTIKILYT